MAYIGNPVDTAFTSLLKQDFSNPSGTSLTLAHAVANANDIALYINNVRQEPTEAYSVNGTTVTLTGSVSNSDDIYVIYLARAVQTTAPPDGSVSSAKLTNDITVSNILTATGGIKLASGTDVLNAYDEGTYSFSVFGDTNISSTSPATTEYSNVGTAKYTLIGNSCTVWIPTYNMASLGLSSGGFLPIRVSLPFTSASDAVGIGLVTGYSLQGRYGSSTLDGIGQATISSGVNYLIYQWYTTSGGGSGYLYMSGTGDNINAHCVTYKVA